MPIRKQRRAGEKLAWHQAEGPASHADLQESKRAGWRVQGESAMARTGRRMAWLDVVSMGEMGKWAREGRGLGQIK